MNKETLHSIIRTGITVAVGIFIVWGVASAQTTFVNPTSAPPGGNISPPVTAGATYQFKNGAVSTGSVGSNNGYTLGTTGSVWDVESNLVTLHIQQLCLGTTCITSFPGAPKHGDVLLDNQSCNGNWCATDPTTLQKICTDNGYANVVNYEANENGNEFDSSGAFVYKVILGGNTESPEPNGPGQIVCNWSGTAWNCAEDGCQSSCALVGLERVSCTD